MRLPATGTVVPVDPLKLAGGPLAVHAQDGELVGRLLHTGTGEADLLFDNEALVFGDQGQTSSTT